MSGANTFVFFLGGQDLEMKQIAGLLGRREIKFHDKNLGWGAKASAYRQELPQVVRSGCTPVLVELADDLDLQPKLLVSPDADEPLPQQAPHGDGMVLLVDHHGNSTRQRHPTSLEQVFFLVTGTWPLGRTGRGTAIARRLDWTPYLDHVAANDRGHIKALRDLQPPPTAEEIAQVRKDDRDAQGITEQQERQAARAVERRQSLCDGRLTVLMLPGDRVAAATDLMEPALGGPGYENLLVVSPNEFNFFGAPAVIEQLEATFPNSWRGAKFWGMVRGKVTDEAMTEHVANAIQAISETAERREQMAVAVFATDSAARN